MDVRVARRLMVRPINGERENLRWSVRSRTTAVTILLLSAFVACRQQEEWPQDPNALFRSVPSSESGIHFSNDLTYTEEFNPYLFRNFFNGGGVGLGDINNDGLVDIFFTGNQVDNRLYLNEGEFRFKDISEEAGIVCPGVWSTGVTLADINADGWLDIYVCKSGPPGGERRHNELFINNGDLTFSERSADYGLDFVGLSTHAAFFDYDKDSDLDCYLLNNSMRSVGANDYRMNQRTIPDPAGGNRLLRNDEGIYVDVSQEAGIYSSAIGYGLGVSVSDLNGDGWLDLYVANDFFEKDYLYINHKDGTFKESLEESIREISLGSMGADVADINNDGLPEVFVTEMLPEHDDRLKTTTQFENWDKYRTSESMGYFRQFSRNVLQLNNGDGTFSEIGRYAAVHATDWSWGALIFDMDLDGLKDIFVANGIYKDLLDQDYVNFTADPGIVREMIMTRDDVMKTLIDSIPSNKLANYAFRNRGDLTFENTTESWGLDLPTHSNGSAYADLDNDGDLDLVVSNVGMKALIYENRARQFNPARSFLTVQLKGSSSNAQGLGSRVTVHSKGDRFMQESTPARGFMSTVESRLNFGLGEATQIDSLTVEWPEGKYTVLKEVEVNQFLTVEVTDPNTRNQVPNRSASGRAVFTREDLSGLDFIHRENDHSDFDRDRLLFNMISNEGPCMCSGDVNKDGKQDFYIGGAKGQSGRLYVQGPADSFHSVVSELLEVDKDSEDTDCVFFDADGNGWNDLYVCSGGNEYSTSSSALLDRLYFNQGNGTWAKSIQPLPVANRFESTGSVSEADYDGDGDTDLFVGTRLIPFSYGMPATGYVLQNDGHGKFVNVTDSIAPSLVNSGLFTSARWTDLNRDGKPDLVVAGEWMPVRVVINESGRLVERTTEWGLSGSSGWYHALEVADVNGDGFSDLITGNHGLNSRFRASAGQPVRMSAGDFDRNGTIEHVVTRYDRGQELPLTLRNDLVAQMPALKKKYLRFESYVGQGIPEIFDQGQMDEATLLEARDLESAVWINTGNNSFSRQSLPREAQFFPVYSVSASDFDGDGKIDIVLGGNLHRAKPETGIYDAGYGLLLTGDGQGKFAAMHPSRSGLQVKGEIRSFGLLSLSGRRILLVGKSNSAPEAYSY